MKYNIKSSSLARFIIHLASGSGSFTLSARPKFLLSNSAGLSEGSPMNVNPGVSIRITDEFSSSSRLILAAPIVNVVVVGFLAPTKELVEIDAVLK